MDRVGVGRLGGDLRRGEVGGWLASWEAERLRLYELRAMRGGKVGSLVGGGAAEALRTEGSPILPKKATLKRCFIAKSRIR